MRIELKPETVERIEGITGKKMTTRCDRAINKALDIVDDKTAEKEDSRPQVKMAPGIMEILKDV